MIADVVAAVLLVVSTAYAALAGADFGGGVWDLLAGSAAGGAAVRNRIDQSITPVWESNHVWLIIALVVLWTGFPAAFGAIFTTLFVPLSVAALGIVLRGSGFAFRGEVRSVRWQRVYGGIFAIASLLTPFFLGTAVGSVVTGRVRDAAGDSVSSWANPTSLLTGALFVATGAYLAAVYLAVDSERAGQPELTRYFTRRALAAGVLTGVLAAVTMAVLHTTAAPVFTELTRGRALPLVIVSVLAGLAVLVLLRARRIRLVRPAAVLAVAAVIWGWAVAQYPYLLPPWLTVTGAAAPTATEAAELVVVGVIALLAVPSFAVLYRLTLSGRLAESGMAVASAGAGTAGPEAGSPGPEAGSAGPGAPGVSPAAGQDGSTTSGRLAAGAVLALVAAEGVRRLRRDRGSR